MFTWFAAVVAAGVVGSCVVGMNNSDQARQVDQAKKAAVEAAKSPEQQAAEAKAKEKQDADFQFAVTAAKTVRDSMKDPASFELVKAVLIDGGAFCLEYRGKNSFNATTTERVAISRSMKPADWNKACGNKTGEDMKRVKYAM